MPVHRRDGADKGVDADLIDQQPGRLMEVIGDVVDNLAPAIFHAALNQRPLGCGNEHAIGADAVVEFVAEDRVSGDPGGLEVVDLEIFNPARCGSIRKRFQKRGRLGHCHADGELGPGGN